MFKMSEENENEEIEVIDVLMNDAEIDEAIAHLMELKEHKTNVQFPLASDLDLSVTYSDDEDEDDDEEDEEVKDANGKEDAKVNAENKIGEEIKHG